MRFPRAFALIHIKRPVAFETNVTCRALNEPKPVLPKWASKSK